MRRPNGSSGRGDLVRAGPEQRAARTGLRCRVDDMRLGDLDLLEDE